jgi:hypothetical protein
MIAKHLGPFLALTLLAACGSKEKEHEEPGATASAAPSSAATIHRRTMLSASAATTAATAAPLASGAPVAAGGLFAGVPVKPATAKAGDRVWSVTPGAGPENALFGVVEIDSLQPDSVTTVSLTRTGTKLAKDAAAAKQAHVPGALVSAAQGVDVAKIKKDEIVIAPVFGYRTTAAHVTKVAGGIADIKYVNGEKVHEETTEYAVPLAKGIAPFAYVAVKSGASYKEVLVAAVVGDQVFGVDEGGTFYKAARADVKPLDVQWKDRKKGDKVVVFDASGSAETTIDTVSVDKWVYKVKVNGAEKRVPFYAVVDTM